MENEELKIKSDNIIQSFLEKMNILIKLNRKYIKKIKNILTLLNKLGKSNLESLNQNRDLMMLELIETVEKFNHTMHNQKLIESIIGSEKIDSDLKNLICKEDNNDNDEYFQSQEINFIETIKVLETEIKKVTEENSSLKCQKMELQTNNDELNEKIEELAKTKKKLNEEKFAKEEIEMSLKNLKQLNKDLESKNKLIENELENHQKTLRHLNEKIKDYELLKNKNSNLQNEIKYKESLIGYLETLLQTNNISFTKKKNYVSDEDSEEYTHRYNKETKDNIQSNFDMKNFVSPTDSFKEKNMEDYQEEYRIKKIKTNENTRDIFKNLKNEIHRDSLEDLKKIRDDQFQNSEFDNKFGNNFNTFKDFELSKTSNLKYEIDNLDSEIRHLQSKLKNMIDINKTN
jgi:hypothetical protein